MYNAEARATLGIVQGVQRRISVYLICRGRAACAGHVPPRGTHALCWAATIPHITILRKRAHVELHQL